MVIDRAGKIAYRTNGFDPDAFESNVAAAIRRVLAEPDAASAAGRPSP